MLHCHYQDPHLLVLEKRSGLLCVPGRGPDKRDCLSTRALVDWPDALVVHRLDQATSGLVLMARGAATQRLLSGAFAARQVVKRYVALVHGDLAPDDPFAWSTIDLPIGANWEQRPLRTIDHEAGKASQTRWRPSSKVAPKGSTRLELEPRTGRTHQLRVHLSALGHPILGDALYGDAHSAARLLLHATALHFDHPVLGNRMKFFSAAPF